MISNGRWGGSAPLCILPFPVSLNRSGIPRCIPSFHRKMISRRDETGDQLVRFFLSMFSLSKLILVRKKGRFGYDSIVKRPSYVPEDLFNDLIQVCLDLVERYVPRALKIPYESWTSVATAMVIVTC